MFHGRIHDWYSWRIANSVLNKGKSAIPPLFNGPEVLSSASDKAKLFPKNFSKNSNLDDSGISLPVFPSRTNLKLHNISITPKMVRKVITNLDSSKVSGPDCIPVVVLKNCEPELFRSSRSTADLLTVVSDRIARAFNRSGATRAITLDISKAFERVWHAGLLHKLKFYGI